MNDGCIGLRWIPPLAPLLASSCTHSNRAVDAPARRPPIVILTIPDDFGVDQVGCYGQKIVRAPSIDAPAVRGRAVHGRCVGGTSRRDHGGGASAAVAGPLAAGASRMGW